MIERDNIEKGDVVLIAGKPMEVLSREVDHIRACDLGAKKCSYKYPYEKIMPLKIKDIMVRISRINGFHLNVVKGDFICIEYFGDTFVNKYFHSFQHQFKKVYGKYFPIHKVFDL